MFGLNKTATVYTPHASTGAYTVTAKSGLRCRLAYINVRGNSPTADDRVEIAQNRRLLWEEAYTIPNDAQVEIDGERWNIKANSQGTLTGPDGTTVIYRRADVVEA